MAFYWKLNDEDLKLAKGVYNERGNIFVDKDGALHTEDGDGFEVVKSDWFSTLDIFTYEIGNTRCIQILRKSNGARNS